MQLFQSQRNDKVNVSPTEMVDGAFSALFKESNLQWAGSTM